MYSDIHSLSCSFLHHSHEIYSSVQRFVHSLKETCSLIPYSCKYFNYHNKKIYFKIKVVFNEKFNLISQVNFQFCPITSDGQANDMFTLGGLFTETL